MNTFKNNYLELIALTRNFLQNSPAQTSKTFYPTMGKKVTTRTLLPKPVVKKPSPPKKVLPKKPLLQTPPQPQPTDLGSIRSLIEKSFPNQTITEKIPQASTKKAWVILATQSDPILLNLAKALREYRLQVKILNPTKLSFLQQKDPIACLIANQKQLPEPLVISLKERGIPLFLESALDTPQKKRQLWDALCQLL